jgi:hypothetical protein
VFFLGLDSQRRKEIVIAQGMSRRGFFGLLAGLVGLRLAGSRPSQAKPSCGRLPGGSPTPPPTGVFAYPLTCYPCAGRVTTITYDVRGRITELASPADPLSSTTTYTYDCTPPSS